MVELKDTIQQVSGQVEVNAKDAQKVSDKAVEAKDILDQGNNYMKELVEGMNEITESSKQISSIISVIEGISGQTNILALNASIEAARAGEQGKGFAVVAEEIGQLANETKDATKTTADLIGRSLKAVTNGASLADRTAEALNKLAGAYVMIMDLANNVSNASSIQANSLEHVNHAVEQISNIVQDNSQIAEETAASSQELTAHAANLVGVLQDFQSISYG